MTPLFSRSPRSRSKFEYARSNGYTQNHGKRGIVYVLGNETLPDLLKIGQTTNLPQRLRQINRGCNTSSPISRYFVLYQRTTEDCGRAEKRAHASLSALRPNKFREFFQVTLGEATRAVNEACTFFDEAEQKKREVAEAERQGEEARSRSIRLSREWNSSVVNAERQRRIDARAAELQREHCVQRSKPVEITLDMDLQSPPIPPSQLQDRKAFALPDAAISIPPKHEGMETSAYIGLGLFLLVVIIGALSEGSQPKAASQQTHAQPDRLTHDLASYARLYRYPAKEEDDETILTEVASLDHRLAFFYRSTDLGERIMTRDFDPVRIQKNMQETACRKEEVKAFLWRGAAVFYILQRKNGQEVSVQLSCQ